MTARRLPRKNKSDVKRFLYVPLPIWTVSLVGSAGRRERSRCRGAPWLAASCRKSSHCRNLSHSVAKRR